MSTTTRPTVHLNGTSRGELARQYEAAREALNAALTALNGATPHARDYYVQGAQAYQAAAAEHYQRIRVVEAVRDELELLLEGVLL